MKRAVPVLLFVVLVLNANALTAFFVGDDYDFLRLIGKMDSLTEAMALQFWGEWEPAWYVSWFLDMKLWGFDPLGYHLTNVAWLALGVVSLFGWVSALRPESASAPWVASLLFAVHPLHDEAVTYLAARGHVMCLALSLLAAWLWVLGRAPGASRLWLGGSGLAALLAALSKETALILPAWIAVTEVLLVGRERGLASRIRSAAVHFFLVAVPVLATLVLRRAVVGLGSKKLEGRAGEWGALVTDMVEAAPIYAMLGGLPVPFGSLDAPRLDPWWWVGWILIALVAGRSATAAYRVVRGVHDARDGMWLLGVAIVFTGLLPVFWADLPLRRRYLFVATAGVALCGTVVFEQLRASRPRWAIPALVVVLGVSAVATWQRNVLYQGAGELARAMIEGTRGVPIGEPPGPHRRVAYVQIPSRFGGDWLSGAYVVHHTDLKSALGLFGAGQPSIAYAMRLDRAEDVETELLGPALVRLRFRTRAAFEIAHLDDPADHDEGNLVRAERIAVDETARTMDYRLEFHPQALRVPPHLLRLSGGRLVPTPIPTAEP